MSGVGKKIKECREVKGWTQEELALKMGYKSKSTINKVECGINDISQTKIVEYAKVLGTTPSYLMGWDDTMTDDNAVLLVDLLENETVLRIAGKMINLNDEQLVTVEAVVDSFTKK